MSQEIFEKFHWNYKFKYEKNAINKDSFYRIHISISKKQSQFNLFDCTINLSLECTSDLIPNLIIFLNSIIFYFV